MSVIRFLSVFLSLFIVLSLSSPIHAQEKAEESAVQAPDDMAERETLARRMLAINSPREIVAGAAASIAMRYPANEHEGVIRTLIDNYDIKGLEDAMAKIMAETYTLPELRRMVEYNESEEARSARAKTDDYQARVHPEIRRRLDEAMLKARTGGGPDIGAP